MRAIGIPMLLVLGVLAAPSKVTASPLLGLNDHWTTLDAPAVAAAEALGAAVARFPVPASVDEVPAPDDPAWHKLDRTVAGLNAASIRPLIVICSEPCHAASISHSYVRFTAAVALRYPQAAIQVWNEPNLTGFFPGGYADLVRAVRRAVPAHTQLVVGGPAPVWEWEAWSRRTFRRLRGLDVIPAMHMYPQARRMRYYKPATLRRIGRYVRDAYEDLRELTDRRPWVTEIGFSDSIVGSETDQAAGMARALDVLTRLRAPTVVVHRLVDAPEHPSAWQRGLGILRPDMSWKPVAEPVAKLGAAR